MSYVSLYPENWRQGNYLALNGTAEAALFRTLEELSLIHIFRFRPIFGNAISTDVQLSKLVFCPGRHESAHIHVRRLRRFGKKPCRGSCVHSTAFPVQKIFRKPVFLSLIHIYYQYGIDLKTGEVKENLLLIENGGQAEFINICGVYKNEYCVLSGYDLQTVTLFDDNGTAYESSIYFPVYAFITKEYYWNGSEKWIALIDLTKGG